MPDEVTVGIAGLGRSGWEIHARVLEKYPAMYRVVAVFDPVEERRREAVSKFGCRAHADFDSLVEDPDVELVVVATPSHLHAPQTIEALNAGKDVICEKPMAATLAEADTMIYAARSTGRLLTVFHNRRYAPDFLKVMEVMRSGKLGRIVLIRMSWHSFGRRWDWQTLREFGGGELRNTASHALDQALQLMGDSEPEVFCDLQRTLTLGDAEDHVKIVLRAPSSPLIDLEVSRACAYPQSWWLVMGTQGGLTGSTSSLQWKYFDPADLIPREVDARPTVNRSYNVEEIPWKEETWIAEEGYKSGEYTYYEELYKTLRQGAPSPVTPESARRVMWVIERCFELSKSVKA